MAEDHRQRLGDAGERTAEHLLCESGLEIIHRKWRDGRCGELDLIARDSHTRTVVAVEVRTRIGVRCGTPLESVDRRKIRILRRLAGAWAARNDRSLPMRIDIVAITLPCSARQRISRGDIPDDLRELGATCEWIRQVA
ncbi:YraN family protein [Schaalia sp. ZJ405]|uniref:YraN family protein n=1 Tax=unclassified Schaalia TaxID=2691889 RepID=UPI0013EA1D53|nr:MULTISPECIES: YraN family protein [unclassified Schaalia]QPK81996.1 YraN family protein [Schaalia sp. ZJ405]